MNKRIVVFLSVIVFRCLIARATPIDWPTLGYTPIVTNIFSRPIGIYHAADGSDRLFIIEQAGRIWIVQSNTVVPQPFVVLTNRVLSTGTEQGLLGMAFPSNYVTSGHFYVDYTRQPDGAIVISRFTISTNSNQADVNSEQIILTIPKPTPVTMYNNHNAGQIAFGPDGLLYIGVGDGGSEGDPKNYGQTTTNFFGKLLRIDVEGGVAPYAVPASNPHVGTSGFAPEIWAYGLRNPWRFSFDRLTGDLYIGDVGQYTYEELDFQPAGSAGGQNYGWRIMEGPVSYIVPFGFTNFSALTAPIFTYNHYTNGVDGSCSITGGFVYRGPSSSRLDGLYICGDFVTGAMWGVKSVASAWTNFVLVAYNPNQVSTNFSISTFGEDDLGALYAASYAGRIYQLRDTLNVWNPNFSSVAGTLNNSSVLISSITPGATIYYTTNGLDPSQTDTVVNSGSAINITSGVTNKIRAFRGDLSPSGVVSAVFTLQVANPGFSPAAGTLTNGTLISITNLTSGATIYYTTNGTTPTTNSLIYSSPFVLAGNITIKALGAAARFVNSGVATANYSVFQTATPVLNPSGGSITNGTAVTLSSSTSGATIFYTLDGSSPTTNSLIYSTPLLINGGTTIKAMAAQPGFLVSGVNTETYQLINTSVPVFLPPNGPIVSGTSVDVSSATPGARFYFTLDGTTPTTNSTLVMGGIVIETNTTVSVFAQAPGYGVSPVIASYFPVFDTNIPPSLQYNLAGTKFALSWPVWANNFLLETSSQLSENAAWTPVTQGITSNYSFFFFTTNIPPSNASFFRLHKQ